MSSGNDGVTPQAFPGVYRQTAAATSRNWMGVAAIISAFIMPLAGLVFGIMGLSAARRGLATNRGLSIAGIVVAVVVTLVSLVLLVMIGPWFLWLLGGGGDGEAFCEQMGNIPWGC